MPSAYTGLTSTDAAARLRVHGLNAIGGNKRFRPFQAFLAKFNSPLLWVITVAAVISQVTGSTTNAIILVAMIFLSVVLDYINTYRSERAVETLVGRVRTMATVVRDGRGQHIPLVDIVPGDLMILGAGDVVPADGYVIEEKDLYVNESTMTGESQPVMKRPVPGDLPMEMVKQRPDAVLMGTSVVTGYARAIAIATGHQTVYGHIAQRLEQSERGNAFEKEIRSFSMFLMRVTAVLVGVVFLLNILGDRGVFDSFLFAVAIAIGLTPELLPVIMTVSLSRGAMRMAKQSAIVKRLPAIQTIGRMDVLCTDKTGTLTENRMSVVRWLDINGQDDERVLREAWWGSRFHTGVANPVDEAIAHARDWSLQGVEKIDEVPFDFERRRESVVINERETFRLLTKGAPEQVLAVCSAYRLGEGIHVIDGHERQRLLEQYHRLSAEGFKLLAVATRVVPNIRRDYVPDDERDMVFSGYIALVDPPKADARAAIDSLEQLGIRLKILTGDGVTLTERVCRDIDLPAPVSITGEQLTNLPDADWPRVVRDTTVFARIDPFQKEKIIRTLRATGAVVGFLGDGINDAPALKAADVGISVNNAVGVAKETADIILMEHSLAAIADGVIEGRKTSANTMKYLQMGLSSNFGNMLSMTLASAFLPFFPMLPTQILLNNFLYDSSQLTLAGDSVDPADLNRPAVFDVRQIRRFMLTYGPVSTIFDLLTFGTLFWMFGQDAAKFQTGWFIESVATQVLVIYVIRTKLRPVLNSRPSRLVVMNTSLIVLIAGLIPYLGIGAAFGFSPLPLHTLGLIAGIVLAYLFVVEITKQIVARQRHPQHA